MKTIEEGRESDKLLLRKLADEALITAFVQLIPRKEQKGVVLTKVGCHQKGIMKDGQDYVSVVLVADIDREKFVAGVGEPNLWFRINGLGGYNTQDFVILTGANSQGKPVGNLYIAEKTWLDVHKTCKLEYSREL